MVDDSEDEPRSDGWLVAMAIVVASLTFGSLVAWIVKVAGG